MYLLYLDDSGSAGNPAESYFVLGGFSTSEFSLHWINIQLDKLAEDLYPHDPRSVEFHASAIFSGNVAPWSSLTKDDRRKAIKDVLGILAKARNTVAFACAVHKLSFPNEDPVELAFEDLCSRFDMQLGRHYQAGERHRGLIILDKTSYETSLQRLALTFRDAGTKWRNLRNISEIPLFVDSRPSRTIQLADHVAYAVFRMYERDDLTYFKTIQDQFDTHDGTVHGLAHKTHDSPGCTCPACMSRRLTKPPAGY